MKYKITDIDFNKIEYCPKELDNGTIVNFTYYSSHLEFQTPKVIIEEIDKEYFLLKLHGTEACKKFFLKILELEKSFNQKFLNCDIKNIFKDGVFIVKIPFKCSRPCVKVFFDGNLFNYYHLSKGMEIICLVTLDKLWITNSNNLSYNLNIKEIMLLKQ